MIHRLKGAQYTRNEDQWYDSGMLVKARTRASLHDVYEERWGLLVRALVVPYSV
jgi:hypothetical protein